MPHNVFPSRQLSHACSQPENPKRDPAPSPSQSSAKNATAHFPGKICQHLPALTGLGCVCEIEANPGLLQLSRRTGSRYPAATAAQLGPSSLRRPTAQMASLVPHQPLDATTRHLRHYRARPCLTAGRALQCRSHPRPLPRLRHQWLSTWLWRGLLRSHAQR